MAKSFQDTIVLFGDSITQEWAAGSLAHRFTSAYSRRLDVLNRGFGGYTSEWNLPIFEKAFAKKKEQKGCPVVRLVTLWLGANDSTFPQRHQHLPLEKYSENMKYYVRSILSPSSEYYQPHAYVLLLTPPPLVEKMREEAKLQYPPEQRTPADRSLDNTKRYRDEIIKIGAEFKRTNPEFADKLRVIDTWAPLIAAAGGDVRDEEAMRRFFTDGLHMTSEGYEIVYNACLDVIKKDFKGLDPDDQTSLPMTFPHWDSVDPKAVRKTVVQAKPKYVVAQKAETGFQSNVLAKLLLFAFLVAVVPIATYFTTIKHAFDGNSTSAAIAAIVSANIVMVAYVVVAFNEDAGPALTKKTQ